MELDASERVRFQHLVVQAKSFRLDPKGEIELRQLTAKEMREGFPWYAPRDSLVRMAVHILRIWAERERGVILDHL